MSPRPPSPPTRCPSEPDPDPASRSGCPAGCYPVGDLCLEHAAKSEMQRRLLNGYTFTSQGRGRRSIPASLLSYAHRIYRITRSLRLGRGPLALELELHVYTRLAIPINPARPSASHLPAAATAASASRSSAACRWTRASPARARRGRRTRPACAPARRRRCGPRPAGRLRPADAPRSRAIPTMAERKKRQDHAARPPGEGEGGADRADAP